MSVESICETVISYKKKINELKEYRRELTPDAAFDLPFVTKLTEDRELFLQFLRDVNLLKEEFYCANCGNLMKLISNTKKDGQQWFCGRLLENGKRCPVSTSIRETSWFSGSRLAMEDILLLTVHILRRSQVKYVKLDYRFSSRTIADWSDYVMETLLEYFDEHPVQIGGMGKVVEVDECIIDKKKIENDDSEEGQWVFAGVERESGRLFVVAVPDRSQSTLVSVLKKWVLPDTFIYSDSWEGYSILGEVGGYIHETAKDAVSCVDPAGVHTNTIRSTWRHLRSQMPTFHQQSDYNKYFADFMFQKWCSTEGYDIMIKFMEIVGKRSWSRRISRKSRKRSCPSSSSD